MSCVQQDILCGKSSDMQTFQPISIIPAMLIDTPFLFSFFFFFFFFITTLTDLDLGWGQKLSAKQNLLASFSCTLFNW